MLEYEYYLLCITITLGLFFKVIFIIIHSHVWTRGGYAGLNQKLEPHEVDKFISHILAEGSFLVLFYISMLEPLTVKYTNFHYTYETKFIFGSTFVGSILYGVGGYIKQKLKRNQDERHEPENHVS